MYGLVNRALEELILSRGGNGLWERVKARAGVDVDTFLSMEPYPDSVTYQLVGALAELSGDDPATVLRDFGQHWILFTGREGYGSYFALAGSTLPQVLSNLDTMHARVGLSFPSFKMPRFTCTEVTERSLRLHYRSEREGLAPFVEGLVLGLGKLFSTDVAVRHVVAKGGGADHDEFVVELAPQR